MHTKTMEGLAGASMNMKLLNTPFRVYKDAERRGDTAVMERAMGYVGEFAVVLLCIINTAIYVFKKKRGREGKGEKE